MRRLLPLCLLALVAAPAGSHDMPMAYVGLSAHADGTVTVTTKSARRGDGLPRPVTLALEPACRRLGPTAADAGDMAVVRRWRLACDAPLAGTVLRLHGLDAIRPEAIVHWRAPDGRETYLRADRYRPQVTLSVDETKTAAGLGAYFGMGVEHILAGPDHLLFVLGLMLVIRRARRGFGALLATVTAFTVAHSLTLALATLGGVTLPATAVEATIALSILLLAVELAAFGRRQAAGEPPTLTFRKPWLVAFAFGLLHGFGFAGALAEIGLPEAARAWALLLFNAGVEAGQVLFVAALALAHRALRHRLPPVRIAGAVTTVIGAVAGFWLIERLSVLIGV